MIRSHISQFAIAMTWLSQLTLPIGTLPPIMNPAKIDSRKMKHLVETVQMACLEYEEFNKSKGVLEDDIEDMIWVSDRYMDFFMTLMEKAALMSDMELKALKLTLEQIVEAKEKGLKTTIKVK